LRLPPADLDPPGFGLARRRAGGTELGCAKVVTVVSCPIDVGNEVTPVSWLVYSEQVGR
jgi:hypothetical protein